MSNPETTIVSKNTLEVKESPREVASDLHTHFDTHPDNANLDDIIDELKAEGEDLNPLFLDVCDDPMLLGGLSWVYEHENIPPSEYIKHSSRFANLSRFGGMFSQTERVVIPVSADNVHAQGLAREHEEGPKMDIDYIKSKNIDPRFVLFFRVTQPSDGQPKPEYYWTSDLGEVRNGLNVELGGDIGSAIILVSTLDTIAQNGGLIGDINDDSGIAVRQIGLGMFDQNKALFSFSRSLKS